MPADGKSNDYHFVTRWEIPGTCEAVSEVLGNPLDFPRWWPSVYLQVEQLRPPDARGLGRRVRLLTKGKLPYTLRWEFEVAESRHPTVSRSRRMATSRDAASRHSRSTPDSSTSRSTGESAQKSRSFGTRRSS
jgi:hypothetical protein